MNPAQCYSSDTNITVVDNNTLFFGHYIINDSTVCDGVVEYLKESKSASAGTVFKNNSVLIDSDIKESIDLGYSSKQDNDSRIERYLQQLSLCVELYKKEYTFIDTHIGSWAIVEPVNIQYYPPGGGYKIWHCERSGNVSPSSDRVLAFMTYLNTIEEPGCLGGTEWYYQNLKVSAKKGHTVIWPADWTFVHRGIVSPNKEKIIITGWYSFSDQRN